jgi:hypothetical protein
MASAYPLSRGQHRFTGVTGPRSLARGMTLHASLALMMFAVLQIAGVILLNDHPGGRILPFVALGTLMLFAVPFSRGLERRWKRLADQALPSGQLTERYRRDRARLWRVAAAVPMLWLGAYAVVAEAAVRL